MKKTKTIILLSIFFLFLSLYSIFTNLIHDNKIIHSLLIKRFDLSYYHISHYAEQKKAISKLFLVTKDDAYSDLILICILNNYLQTAEYLINNYPYTSFSKSKIIRFYSICSFFYYRIKVYDKAIEYCKKILVIYPGNRIATKNLYFLLNQNNTSEKDNSESVIDDKSSLYEMLIKNKNTSENEGVQNFIEEKFENSNEKIDNYYW